ncbi:MAG TPA: helix-turn-helix domain-containing protein [Acidimicrobiales bacterium]|nr:helix-turn-helix domain-containing protein [Acidimicrobiales bacterium]
MDGVSAEGTYLTPGQVARMLGVSAKTVYRWATAGRIPCVVTLGGHRRFRRDDIAAVASSMGLDSGRGGDEGG